MSIACMILGESGTGKSTVMSNAIVQQMRDGRGVLVAEPHGSLAEDILARVPIPFRRTIAGLGELTLFPQSHRQVVGHLLPFRGGCVGGLTARVGGCTVWVVEERGGR